MKRTLLFLLLAPLMVFSQKQVKPNLNKALNFWKTGKLEDAKNMIDLATTYEKTMNDGKTWYYRGLIYATIDTTSNEQDHALASNAFEVAIESFAKAEQLKDKNEYFIPGDMGLPILISQQIPYWSQNYLVKGVDLFQTDDYEGALLNFEKVQKINPKDTTSFFYGAFVAQSLEQYDKAVEYFYKYLNNGGTSSDAYGSIINIYSSIKEDKQKALEVVREARKKYPENEDYPKVEIGMLIDLGQIDEARTGLENAIKTEPNNKLLHFYLGYVNSSLKNDK